MKTYGFGALLARMKYIPRWCLMRCARAESLCEHTAEAAELAHLLCVIENHITGESSTAVRSEKVAVAALYHDASEVLTGDMPTPVKYKNERLKTAYKALEYEGAQAIVQLLPTELQPEMATYLTGEELTLAERKLLKAADRLSAIIKCTEEQASGNREFDAALASQLEALHAMGCPAAEYFLTHFLPCYAQNLDELTAGKF